MMNTKKIEELTEANNRMNEKITSLEKINSTMIQDWKVRALVCLCMK